MATFRVATRNTRANTLRDDIGPSALLRLYTADYGTLLSEHLCDAVQFAPDAVDGVVTANFIEDGIASGSGDAARARLYQQDGVTLVVDALTVGDVHSTTDDVVLDQEGTLIATGDPVVIDSFGWEEGNAA
jgi:hypothetical protein